MRRTAIAELQCRLREIGRIRLGGEKPASGDRPGKPLLSARLTSQDRSLIEACARLYGGQCAPWENGGVKQWQVYTEAEELPIFMGPQPAVTIYEHHAGAICERRCDGSTCMFALEGGGWRSGPCACDPERMAEKDLCRLTTRLWVWLPEVPGLGAWRLESHGYYAALELPAAADLLRAQTEAQNYIPASLAIEVRSRLVKCAPYVRDGATCTTRQKKYIVPVIRLKQPLVDALCGPAGDTAVLPTPAAVAALTGGSAPALPSRKLPTPGPSPRTSHRGEGSPKARDAAELLRQNLAAVALRQAQGDESTIEGVAVGLQIVGRARAFLERLTAGMDPEAVRRDLQELAEASGKSLNAQLILAMQAGVTSYDSFLRGEAPA